MLLFTTWGLLGLGLVGLELDYIIGWIYIPDYLVILVKITTSYKQQTCLNKIQKPIYTKFAVTQL